VAFTVSGKWVVGKTVVMAALVVVVLQLQWKYLTREINLEETIKKMPVLKL